MIVSVSNKAILATLVTLVLSQISASFDSAQQNQQLPFEDEIIKFQVAALNGINAEFQNHVKFCEMLKRNMSKATRNTRNMRSGDSVDIATGEDYLNCAAERFESTARAWLKGNGTFLNTTKDLLKNILHQQVTEQTVTKAQLQPLANATGFIHTRLKTWHQAMANFSQALFDANLFTESQKKEIMDVLQKNVNRQTSKARDFLSKLNSMDNVPKADVLSLLDSFVEDVFSPLAGMSESIHAKCQISLKRIKKLYPVDLGKRPNRFHEVVDLYENTIVNSTEAMKTQTLNMWLPIDEKGTLRQL